MKRLFRKFKQKTNFDPMGILNKPFVEPSDMPDDTIVSGSDTLVIANRRISKKTLVIFAAAFAAIGAIIIIRSFAATTADVTVTVDRTTSNGTSNWVPAHTSVSTEFYNGFGQNQGPDTQAGTAQYNARALELEGVSQHNVHIMAWGRSSPWKNATDPVPDPNAPYNTGSWGGYGMDQEIKRAADKGLQPTITLAMAPGWMEGQRTSGNGIVTPLTDYDPNTFYDGRVATDKMPQWLQLVDSIVTRYSKAPYNVRTYDIWNEFKGFYNSDINNYDAGTYPGTPGKADMGYTYFYNMTRAQILASAKAAGVTSGIRTGGPYIVDVLWDQSGAGGFPVTDGRGSVNNTLSGAKSYGWVDGRPLDAIKTWLANKSGAEFIALRFSNVTRPNPPTYPDGRVLGNDWDSLQYAGDLAKWVRGLPESTYPGASTLPLWNAEHYTTPSTDTGVAAKYGAFSAESYRIGVRSGYEAMLRWGADGLDGPGSNGVDLWTTTPIQDNHELRAGDGLPGNGQEAQKLFKQYFSKGTKLYPETISDTAKVSALANATHTLLINKTNTQLNVSVDGTIVTLSPYAVIVVPVGNGAPAPSLPVLTLKLMNADTDQVISSMTNGMTIDLKNARNLNIDASADVAIESVRFDDNGQIVTENLPPYAIGGDAGTNSTDYLPWTPTVGSHTMTVKAYSADGAVGELATTTISFTVTDSSAGSLPGWKLLWEDNFDGTALNKTLTDTAVQHKSAWQPYNGPGNGGNGLRQESAISVANGELVITAKNVDSDGNGTLDKVSSGGMSNATNTKYGRFEARVRTELDPSGVMSGVILTWPQSNKWPDEGENDFYETGTDPDSVTPRNPFSSFIHYPVPPPLPNPTPQAYVAHNADGTQYHDMAMEWSPDFIKIYRDGALIKTINEADNPVVNGVTYVDNIPDFSHHMTIQLDATKSALLSGPVRMYVDRAAQYELVPGGGSTDTTPPDTTITAKPAASTTSTTADFSFTATEAGSFACKLDAGAFAACTSPKNYTGLSVGSHTFSVQAADAAGNTDASPATYTWTITSAAPDTSPTANITTPAANAAISGNAYNTATTATDDKGITKVEFYLDNTLKLTQTETVTSLPTSKTYNYGFDTFQFTNNTQHTFMVKVYDGVNATPASASVSFTVNNPDTQAPTAPTNLRLNGTVTATSVPLAWNASTDNVGVTKYNVLRNGVVIGSTAGLTYTDPTSNATGNPAPSANTAYQYSVQAIDAATNVGPSSSNLVVNTPAPPDTIPPTMPTNLTATAPSSYQVNLSWTASTDTGGSGLAGYNVYRNGSTTPLNTTLITTTSYGDANGLVSNTAYSYQVEAVDGAGNKSDPKAGPVNVITPIDPTPTITMAQPSDGSSVSGQVTISAQATDNIAVSRVEIYIDDKLYAATSSTSITTTWNTNPKRWKGRSHTITAKAQDNAGSIASKQITVTVQ